ncbi:metal ABC transporter ATP-binding protein [Latilactobacillus sakei]|uniref:metal ABC transporter ATP-binding protein n=1 Tax=Latilactobacillus sakei TaxID=1599 RepID=UPI000C128C30|nr:ATP-binding cassette domain-containing protein [Latilactobacillus sakei]QVQ49271.1 ATP-binding cassette domain-containing protein [Latilactobacillus sakei subsp. sakei]SON70569.1 putative zinc/iron ABC transporter, ATP-binding subunit [Latilactobacillus sakei]
MTELVSAKNLGMTFSNRQVLKDLNFKIEHGSMTSLIGPNGVGKTTLVRILIGSLQPTAGELTFLPDKQSLNIGYVPQFRNLEAEYPLSIRSFVSLNQLTKHLPWHTKSERQALDNILAQTHLTALQKTTVGNASGGEKQKAYLAQALISEPDLLILDESTASLDIETKEEVMALVAELNRLHGLTVIFVTHDLDLARKYTDQYLFLKRGQYEMGPMSQLDPNLELD